MQSLVEAMEQQQRLFTKYTEDKVNEEEECKRLQNNVSN